MPPSDLLAPGPHQYDGYTMSFWQWVEHEPDAALPTREAGPMLRDLHETLRGYRPAASSGELPLLEIFNEITRWLKFLEGRRALSGGELIQLRETHWRLAETLRYGGRAIQPIHGDAHRKNLLKTAKGWLWTDFEDACGGPTAWDVACLVRTAPEGIETALTSYPGAPTWDELLPYLRARELEAVVYWQLQARALPRTARRKPTPGCATGSAGSRIRARLANNPSGGETRLNREKQTKAVTLVAEDLLVLSVLPAFLWFVASLAYAF